MGKNRAPAPPDPRTTSAAQTGTNVSTAVANAFLTNMNETTPWGSRTFDQTGSMSFTDPYTNQTYQIPRFSTTTTLSPEQQAIFDQGQGTELNLATLANDRSGFLNNYLGEEFSYGPGEHEQWSMGLFDSLNGDRMGQQQEQARSELVNRGIRPGTSLYDREMQRLMGTQENARNQFMLDSFRTGREGALAERNQPLNEIIGLMSGSQVQAPNFSTAPNVQAMPTTDNAAIINNNYAQRMNAWSQNQAAAGGLFSGLGSLASAAIPMLSDERAKDDIEEIGKTHDGQPIYRYRYKGSNQTQIGLMAQDVVKKNPQAVSRRPDGLMAVDYAKALEG